MSMLNSFWYCGTNAFFGSINTWTSIASDNEWNGIRMGNRPTNSGIIPNSIRSRASTWTNVAMATWTQAAAAALIHPFTQLLVHYVFSTAELNWAQHRLAHDDVLLCFSVIITPRVDSTKNLSSPCDVDDDKPTHDVSPWWPVVFFSHPHSEHWLHCEHSVSMWWWWWWWWAHLRC